MSIETISSFDEGNSFLDSPSGDSDEQNSPLIPVLDGQDIDYRYTQLSYSSRSILHECPRKFQLYRLNADAEQADRTTEITFAFGHVVGSATQELIISKNLERTVFNMFLNWKPDLEAVSEKHKKSLPYAIAAIQQLYSMLQDHSFLSDYDVLEYNGRPAQELGFKVLHTVPHSHNIKGLSETEFALRGFMDLGLRDSTNGEAIVIEGKTTSLKWVHSAMYKNSDQALSYSLVLDKIEQGTSSYLVKYLIYITESERWEVMEFPKTYHQRAMSIRDLMYDIEDIVRYVEREGNYGNWPMRGESCMSYGKPCQYFDICELDTKRIMKPLREIHKKKEEEKQYDFVLKLSELLEFESTENC